MTNQDLLEIFNSSTLTEMLVFLDQENKGLRFLGFLKQYEFIESRDTLSLSIVDGNSYPILYPWFSHYLISDVKAVAINPGGVILHGDCYEKITKIKTGILESLKICEPLLKRIEKE